MILSANGESALVPKKKVLRALNGPCEGASVDAPYDVIAGNACALPWHGPQGPRYAVYLAIEHNGELALMYMQSYATPDKAAAKVRELSAVAAVGLLDEEGE